MATIRRAIPIEELDELFSIAYDTTFGVSVKPVEVDNLSEVLVVDFEGSPGDLSLMPGESEELV